MALLICLAAGIRPIVTSSSDEKIAKLKEISPVIEGINYKTSDVRARTLELTDGKGVDFLINNVGLSSLPDDLELIRKTGIIAFLGFLGGFEADFDPQLLFTVLLKACRIQ
jgi:NADPH:quinone reductase-like Zn-dependent oxidoreductase